MSDARPIESFNFGLEWEPKLAEVMLQHPWPNSAFVAKEGASDEDIQAALDQWRRRMAGLPTDEALTQWKLIHGTRLKRLVSLFDKCQVKTRDDVEELGCTGCIAYGLSIDDIQFMRIGLAGSGVGLPCFVPPDRYCLAHGVSGGLQDGQTVRWGEFVEKVARPLTPAEQAHAKLVAAARKSEREHGAHSLLHGHTMPAGWKAEEDAEDEADGVQGGAQVEETLAEAVEGLRADGGIDDIVAAGKMRGPLFAWKCDEHDKTDWACRHCVAQAVVEGELVPVFVLGVTSPPDMTTDPPTAGGFALTEECAGERVTQEIADEDTADSSSVKLYVRVATFTRKLARD